MIFACKTASLRPELQVSMGPRPYLWFFFIQNNDFSTRITSLYGSQTSPMVLGMQNIVINTRISSLHCSQAPPVVLCMQINVISIRNTSLYGSLPSSAVFACQTAALGPELQVSMGP